MKKLISFALVLMLVLSLSTAAFAVQDETNGETRTDGSITVEGVVAAHTYSLYKLLHLHTYNENTGACTYTVEPEWAAFFAQETIQGVYVRTDNADYVTWIAEDSAKVAFAQIALAYAQDSNNNISAIETVVADSDADLVFDELSLGYYLMDTSMGALCGLTTTNPTATIEPKNGVPTIEKKVEEDSNPNVFGESNTADMGQVVNFKVTIDVKLGAQNYVFHDQMDAGLTFHDDSVRVTYNDATLTKDEDYKVVTNHTDCIDNWNCTFAVEFLKDLDTTGSIVIEYTATLNAGANVGPEGNKNAAILTYGDNHKTTTSQTITRTYGFDIFKTDNANLPLQGAEFQLLANGTPMSFIAIEGGYRVAAAGEEGATTTIVVSDVSGLAKIKGLDAGTYYLKETKAPDGYRIMADTREVIISNSNLYAENDAAVHVINNKGALLPETGGLGTVLFTVLGGSTALGTGVVLVTKKRMSKIEDEE